MLLEYLRYKKREKLEALGNWNQLASVRHERDDAAAAGRDVQVRAIR